MMTTSRTFASAFVALAGLLIAALTTGCGAAPRGGPPAVRGADEDEQVSLDEVPASVPFVFVYMFPKYPLPGEEVVGGLKVAVWPDGKVVRARSAAEVGKAYVRGTLKPEQLDGLLRSIKRSGILATEPDESSPLHAASDLLKIRTRSGPRAWSHSSPAKENALVKQIEEALMTIEINNAAPTRQEAGYPREWDK